MLCYSIPKQRVHTQINAQVKQPMYNWVLYYIQVVQSPISNDFLKVSIYGNTEKQVIPELLLQVSVRELHDRMVNLP